MKAQGFSNDTSKYSMQTLRLKKRLSSFTLGLLFVFLYFVVWIASLKSIPFTKIVTTLPRYGLGFECHSGWSFYCTSVYSWVLASLCHVPSNVHLWGALFNIHNFFSCPKETKKKQHGWGKLDWAENQKTKLHIFLLVFRLCGFTTVRGTLISEGMLEERRDSGSEMSWWEGTHQKTGALAMQ